LAFDANNAHLKEKRDIRLRFDKPPHRVVVGARPYSAGSPFVAFRGGKELLGDIAISRKRPFVKAPDRTNPDFA